MNFSLNKQILTGVGVGIVLGLLVLVGLGKDSSAASGLIYCFNLIGTLFINMLKMILIPLIFVSISVGIANLQAHAQMGKVWKITLIYFFCSTGLAIILGLICVNVFKPGVGLEQTLFQEQKLSSPIQNLTVAQHIENFIFSLFANPVSAMANTDVLPTVVFAIFIGIALVVVGDKAAYTSKLFQELFTIIMLIVDWIMRFAPLGIGALVAKLVATQDIGLLFKLFEFIMIVIGATLFHGFVVLPAILKLITGIGPKKFFTDMRPALLTAFSTSSSSATLPVTMRCVEKNLKVDKNIGNFILPLGATVNMDGTALYEAVAAIFVANLIGIELSFVQQIVVFFMAMIASIGAPGIPSAGMVTMAMVLKSVGLPIEAIAILLPVDKLLDTVRTMVNVEGDAVASCIVQKLTAKS